ncbi:hypothetical protein K3179_10150 [Qipengyuania sp. GH38]|uniref:Rap1a/Tai family immunity protein n=1 Tax=Qipengyuania intermedia TaxID=2867244 RepID=UPI001C8798CB|nr:Rap1a/Tai family immunity protein [Qipengyuania intermedia]MBX7514902.1 hypothetical protein [Qipengyuania intermedia]
MRSVLIAVQICSALLIAKPANATPYAGAVEELLEGEELERSIATVMVSSMAEGIFWANTLNDVRGLPQHYCPPKQLAIIDEQYVQIFKTFMEANEEERENPLGSVLLLALRDAFPCTD